MLVDFSVMKDDSFSSLFFVFQAKFMPYTGDSTIVSCARDGKVSKRKDYLTQNVYICDSINPADLVAGESLFP